MFTGEYRHSLDAKKRIFIPSKFRDVLGTSFVICRDPIEPCLKVYPEDVWKAYVAQYEREPADCEDEDFDEDDDWSADEARARVLRFLYREMIDGETDAQGRVTLTDSLIARAEITKDAVFVGCGRYGEIWSAENYAEKIDKENVGGIATDMRRLKKMAKRAKA